MGAELCPYCNDKAFVVRNGWRYNKSGRKQKYFCRKCGKSFTFDDGFLRMRNKKEHVVEAVSLYKSGLSLRCIKEHMWQHHALRISRWSLLCWVRRFSKLISRFASTLMPKIKGVVHADEVQLKVKGRACFYWGAKDKVTRFRLAVAWTQKREYLHGAKELFRRLKYNADGAPPKIITDKLGHYRRAFNKYFLHISELVHGVPIASRLHGLEHNNNPIERDNQRIKQRCRGMRGFKNFESASDILALVDNCHNLIDPHSSLQGKTPAELADIKLNIGRNRLLSLIEISAKMAKNFSCHLIATCSTIRAIFKTSFMMFMKNLTIS